MGCGGYVSTPRKVSAPKKVSKPKTDPNPGDHSEVTYPLPMRERVPA